MPASHQLAPLKGAQPMWPGFLKGQEEKPVRVLLIDDDPNMSHVIAHELLGDLRINLVGQGRSVRDGRRLISRNEFDVMLVDLNLSDGSGFDLIEYMKVMRPAAEAIVISALEEVHHAFQAFKLGATGYLVKNSWFGDFAQAVLQVVNGGASITPNLARRLLKKFAHPQVIEHTPPKNKGKDMLSEREKEVLQLEASGHTSIEIGARLIISGPTVTTHINNIYRKFNVRTRAQAVNFAATCGLF
ncbi:MAG: response regulator transcription factor [Polaromonas sp.]